MDTDEQIERLKRQNAQLKQWALMTDEEVVLDLKKLITELCDALEWESDKSPEFVKRLLQRAREAVKYE